MFLLSKALARVWDLVFYKGVDKLSPSHWIADAPTPTQPGPGPSCALSDWTGPMLGLARQQSACLQPFCPRSYLKKDASCLAAKSHIFKDEEIPTFF